MPTLRETVPLQQGKITKKSAVSIVGLTLFAAIFGAAVYAVPMGAPGEPGFIAVGVPVLRVAIPVLYAFLVIWTPIYERLYFTRYFYDMDARTITIRKGVFAQREITLPFSKITDVYVDQDLMDVLFGLYDVHISTPTEESGRFAHIDGVNREDSQRLRDLILEHIHSSAR